MPALDPGCSACRSAPVHWEGCSGWPAASSSCWRRQLLARRCAISGFGIALLATPLFLLFLDPARAIQVVIIISTAVSIVVVPGLLQAIAPWLLMRLALGSLVGLPIGLVAFRYTDPILVQAAAGAMIFGFAILMGVSRLRSGQPGQGKQ